MLNVLKKYLNKLGRILKLYWNPNIFIPLVIILTLIAFINTLQTYSNLPVETLSLIFLFKISISKIIYFWYFIILALIIYRHFVRIQLNPRKIHKWLLIHVVTLILSFLVHESVMFALDKILWNKEPQAELFFLLFNNPFVWIETLAYMLLLLSFHLIEYRKKVRENEVKCAEIEAQLVISKLKELRNKIQPSFLFNTLQTILDMIKSGRNKDADKILSLLSDFLRTTVYDTERSDITLKEEISFLNQYLQIEKLRNDHILEYIVKIDDDCINASVPNFILQPVIERLIYLYNEIKPTVILLEIFKRDNNLEISIDAFYKNNFVDEIKNNLLKDSVLGILKDRLEKKYGEGYKIIIQSSAINQISIRIQIPYYAIQSESEAIFIMEDHK